VGVVGVDMRRVRVDEGIVIACDVFDLFSF